MFFPVDPAYLVRGFVPEYQLTSDLGPLDLFQL